MALSPEAIARRRHTIGASEAAAVLGLSPYATPADIYFAKVIGEKPKNTSSTEAGDFLEVGILDRAEAIHGPIKRQCFAAALDPFAFLSATSDALIVGKREGIEAKTCGITHYAKREELDQWGEEDTDEVPVHYLIQCQHQAFVHGLDRVWLHALIGGRGFRRYLIERDESLIASIVGKLGAFWTDHVLAKVPPGNASTPLEILKGREPVAGKSAVLDESQVLAVEEWEAAKARCKESDAAKEEAEAKMLEAIGDINFGELPDGRTLKRQAQSQTRIDLERLRTEYPAIAAQLTVRSMKAPQVSILKGSSKK